MDAIRARAARIAERDNALVSEADSRLARAANVEVYLALGYRQAGMVGRDLAVAKPLQNGRKGHCVHLIGPDGKTVKTLIRYDVGSVEQLITDLKRRAVRTTRPLRRTRRPKPNARRDRPVAP
ncbi:MAG: hypothetical protein ACREXX_19105 [Gammaproteobacteria bacterium]